MSIVARADERTKPAAAYPAVQRRPEKVGCGPQSLALAVIHQALWDLSSPGTREDARAFLYDPDRREDRAFWCRAADINTDALEALGSALSKPEPKPTGVEFDTNDQRNLRTRLIGAARPKWSTNYHSVTTWRPSWPEQQAGRESEPERIRRLDREANLRRREMSDQGVTFLPFKALDYRYLCYDRVARRTDRSDRKRDHYEVKSTAYSRGSGKHSRKARGF